MFNPAFAGLDHETNFQIGNQFSRIDSAKAYNLFYATYDSYSDKLKGGIAIYFQQGLIGSKNIGTTELGFAYAGIPRKTASGTIRFGFNTNILLATKQWTIYTLDRIMVNDLNEPNLPGEELIRYFVLKPRVSFLWDMPALTWGISIGSNLKIDIADPAEETKKQFPFSGSFYLSKNCEGYHKGLHSRPFVFNPELMLYYQDEYALGRLNLYSEFTRSSLGVFIQSNFTDQVYSFGGIAGFAFNNLRINLSAGAGIPGLSDNFGLTAELSLILKIPQFDYSKINPWQPQ